MSFKVENETIYMPSDKVLTFSEILEGINSSVKDIVYIGGSLVEGYVDKCAKGMGNSFSDLDVFIIRNTDEFCQTEAEYTTTARRTFFRTINKMNLDIEVYDYQYVRSLSDTLKRLDFTREKDTRVFNMLKNKLSDGGDYRFVNEFLNRFKNSLCIYNNDSYNDTIRSMPFDKFTSFKIHALLNIFDSLSDDVKGNLDARETDTALDMIRRLLKCFYEIILTKENVLVDRDKWIILKFVNLCRLSGEKYKSELETYYCVFRGRLQNNHDCLVMIEKHYTITLRRLEDILLVV